MQSMPFETLDIALDCLRAHPTWYLFPISRLEKYPPCFPNNLVLASNDPKQLRKWFTQYPGCNWGISLKKSRLIVPDVDTKPGKNGQRSLDRLELEHGPLPETLTVRTPSGGLHYYYEEANGVSHQMRVNAFGDGIDSTNYVLVPGCWLCTNNQQPYEIINDAPVAPAPEWFSEYLAERIEVKVDQAPAVDLDTKDIIQRAIYYLQNDARPSIQGQNGEFALLMTFAVLKDMGLSEDTAIELVNEYYNVPGKCEPQWTFGEGAPADRLDAKARNAWAYLKNTQPGALSPQAEFGSDDAALDEDSINRTLKVYLANPGLPKKVAPSDSEIKKAVREEIVEALRGSTPPAEPEREAVGEVATSKAPQPNSLPLSPLASIDFSKRAASLKEVCRRWVWVVGIKRFVNRADPSMQWDTKQFDSQYNQFSDRVSISSALFKEGNLLRKFHYLAFRPGAAETSGVEYNVWRASPIQPVIGDTALWNEHINYLFQNEDDANKVLNWMAFVLQNPQLKPNHALLIVGKNTGTGKSLVARIFEQIIGVKNTQRPKNSSMGGDFNSWLKDCRLCILEEVYQVGRRENLNAMRDLITEARVEVNIKGIPAFAIDNYVSMMGISNHPDALPLDDYDRRWLVVETFATRKDESYYAPLFKLLDNQAGLGAIYAELLERDLQGYNGMSAAPETKARGRMIELSRSDEETWLKENAGNPPLSRNIVQVKDVIDAMPANLQRSRRLMTVTIPTFLADRLNGKPHPAQVTLRNGTKVRLWVLHGRYEMVKNENLAALYENEIKEDRREADTSAKADFED